MSTISKSLLGFLFDGATVALATAPWKNNVRAIYGFNAAGNGYQVFKPGNRFNSLAELAQDGAYILDALTPGFELPGATLGVVPAVPTPSWPTTSAELTNGPLQLRPVEPHSTPFGYQFTLSCSSSDPLDTHLLLVCNLLPQVDERHPVPYLLPLTEGSYSSTFGLRGGVPGGTSSELMLFNQKGNYVGAAFSLPVG